jgi:hypothetical protein
MDPRRFFNSLPIAGGVFSGLWGDPDQEAHQKAMQQAQEMLKGYRSDQMDSRMNAMTQGAQGFGPRNQMLGQMMGQQGPAMDLAPMMQNPMSQTMQGGIRAAAFGSAPPPTDGRNVGGGWNGVGPQNPYRPVA